MRAGEIFVAAAIAFAAALVFSAAAGAGEPVEYIEQTPASVPASETTIIFDEYEVQDGVCVCSAEPVIPAPEEQVCMAPVA